MEFLGSIGGVSRILMQTVAFLIGGYSKFQASFATISMLYKIKSEEKLFDENEL